MWIGGLRGWPESLREELALLLDRREIFLPVVVRLELLAGASQKQQPLLAKTLAALPSAEPSLATWARIEGWIQAASARGKQFGIPDLLLAALAAESAAPVWSLDRAFPTMAEFGWIKLYEPEIARGVRIQ